ncbi:long-chain fatty acid--CoA ligase [Brevibacterium aurantiacum]|uniref:Long-chain fatty acid--CoA ligase n=2 Tax=Brevibacterium aurantiacum TaxID=273384 RepID=A0A556CE80_BREAU|nr:long-chain fatty acid--CoA ligase [Brevibacterium aurantiacum]
MRLSDFLDKGASVNPQAPCLTTDGTTLSYEQVQSLSVEIAAGLAAQQVSAGDKIAIISGNDPTAFTCVFGISRVGAVWCPINPRNEAEENRELLELSDCTVVIYAGAYAELVERIRAELPMVHTWICLDAQPAGALGWEEFLDSGKNRPAFGAPVDDLAMVVGTGGTTGRPKGVMLSNRNLETMTALTLMSYPFTKTPVYLAMAPLTHAAGVLCFPILSLGGEIVIMRGADVGAFLANVEAHGVTHSFLPPTIVYMILAEAGLETTDLSSLECLWYGAAPMSPVRLEEAIERIGPVMAQLFGQTEAPMMISTMAPRDHFLPDGSLAENRLSSAGRPTPLCTVEVMSPEGEILSRGERGEIVVRGSLVMDGYYKNPEATEEATRFGWHHTGDIGYLDEDDYLYVVDRAKDMIITGGFNVYSTEVEQALLSHPDVQDCAVIGLPDEHWGEMVTAVVQLRRGGAVTTEELRAHVKARIGSIKTPKRIDAWSDLPRSKVGKVLKVEIRDELLKDETSM